MPGDSSSGGAANDTASAAEKQRLYEQATAAANLEAAAEAKQKAFAAEQAGNPQAAVSILPFAFSSNMQTRWTLLGICHGICKQACNSCQLSCKSRVRRPLNTLCLISSLTKVV